MRTNSNAISAQSPSDLTASNLAGRTFDVCIAAARLLAGGTLVLGIVYAPSWVGILTAWYLG
jgi:hypothetical protein